MSYIGYVPAAKPLTSADITDSIITSAKIADGTIALADLSATGTKDSTTFLRGDNTFATAGATAGQVIQVVSATDSTQRSTTSTSFVTASSTLSVSITPSSSSNKILILVSNSAYVGANNVANFTIYRNGSTNLGGGSESCFSRLSSETYGGAYPFHISYLDSPSTTSATTYQLYLKTDYGTLYINNGIRGSITALEIKG